MDALISKLFSGLYGGNTYMEQKPVSKACTQQAHHEQFAVNIDSEIKKAFDECRKSLDDNYHRIISALGYSETDSGFVNNETGEVISYV